MPRRIVSLLIISLLLASLGCVTSLKDYQAKSPDEQAIKAALLRWETSWNNGDPAGVLSVISDQAQIMYGSPGKTAIASKKQYAAIIPQRMKANPVVNVGLPQIRVTGDKAVADTSLSTGVHSMPVNFEFVKTRGQWLVTRFTY